MKRIAFIITLIFLFSCNENERKIKMISDSRYSVEDNFGKSKVGDLEYKVITSFDEFGKLKEMKDYLSNGSLYSKDVYKYNEDGNLIEKLAFNEADKLSSKDIYVYDSAGNKIGEKNYYVGNKYQNYEYAFLTETEIINEKIKDDDFFSMRRFEYNTLGNKIKEIYSSPSLLDKRQTLSYYTFTYDDYGKVIEEDTYYESDTLISIKIFFKYNKEGKLIEENKYDVKADDLIYNKTYKYDNKSRLIEEVDQKKYDENIIWKEIYSDFDNTNNWLKKELFKNGELVEINNREIVYY